MLWDTVCHYKALWNYHRACKVVPYGQALGLWWRNRRVPYAAYRLLEMRRFKRSDTIFLLGSGPSLNSLSAEELQLINQHDSLGLSWSFLKEEIRATYHLFFWHLTKVFPMYEKIMSHYRERMRGTVVFVSDKNFATFLHPRVMPGIFPLEPKVCYYRTPPLIGIEQRPFSDEDFEMSFFYRNAMTLAIHLAVAMNYKKIVLLGVDPDKQGYFWSDYSVMKELVDLENRGNAEYFKSHNLTAQNEAKQQYYYMYSEPGRVHPFDVYLRSADSFLRRRRGAQLYVSHKTSVLHPDIPAYFV